MYSISPQPSGLLAQFASPQMLLQICPVSAPFWLFAVANSLPYFTHPKTLCVISLEIWYYTHRLGGARSNPAVQSQSAMSTRLLQSQVACKHDIMSGSVCTIHSAGMRTAQRSYNQSYFSVCAKQQLVTKSNMQELFEVQTLSSDHQALNGKTM